MQHFDEKDYYFLYFTVITETNSVKDKLVQPKRRLPQCGCASWCM